MSGLGLPKTAIDGLPIEDRRQVLLDLARLEEPTLSMVGGVPESSTVFVLDTYLDLAVGAEDEALRACARNSSLEIDYPVEVPSGSDVPSTWEVRMRASGSAEIVIATGPSYEHALLQMRQSLRDLCGDQVIDLKTWAQLQSAGSLEEMVLATVPERKKLSPFVEWERGPLAPLPIAKDLMRERNALSKRKRRRKEAYAALGEPQGLGSHSGGLILKDLNIPFVRDDGVCYANHHDILSALRLGLNPEGIEPWPCDVAHKFLVTEELRATMRQRGYVQISDFDPAQFIALRVSLPEFSVELTGDQPPRGDTTTPLQEQEKPAWPPKMVGVERVVIILNRARLAYEHEPEWETVSLRTVFKCAGYLWVEIKGPVEKKKSAPRKSKNARATASVLTFTPKSTQAAKELTPKRPAGQSHQQLVAGAG